MNRKSLCKVNEWGEYFNQLFKRFMVVSMEIIAKYFNWNYSIKNHLFVIRSWSGLEGITRQFRNVKNLSIFREILCKFEWSWDHFQKSHFNYRFRGSCLNFKKQIGWLLHVSAFFFVWRSKWRSRRSKHPKLENWSCQREKHL